MSDYARRQALYGRIMFAAYRVGEYGEGTATTIETALNYAAQIERDAAELRELLADRLSVVRPAVIA